MTDEQFKRANEIHKLAADLMNKRDLLADAAQQGVTVLKIMSPKTFDYNAFTLTNNGVSPFRDQPESVKTIVDAMVQTLLTVYQREIDKLEAEFNAL